MNLDGGFRKVGMNLHEDRSMNLGHGDGILTFSRKHDFRKVTNRW